jgi:hypothetical protein
MWRQVCLALVDHHIWAHNPMNAAREILEGELARFPPGHGNREGQDDQPALPLDDQVSRQHVAAEEGDEGETHQGVDQDPLGQLDVPEDEPMVPQTPGPKMGNPKLRILADAGTKLVTTVAGGHQGEEGHDEQWCPKWGSTWDFWATRRLTMDFFPR